MNKKKLTINEVMSPWEKFPGMHDIPNWDGTKPSSEFTDEEFMELQKNLDAKLKDFAQTATLTEMLEIGNRFGKDPEDSFDMHFEYRHLFEKMPNYPPVELFTDTSDNKMFMLLRARCYGHIVVPYDESIATFYKLNKLEFDSGKLTPKDVDNVLSSELISKMSRHEVRLILELVASSGIQIDYWAQDLFARIDVG
jgi:hypothetical protein